MSATIILKKNQDYGVANYAVGECIFGGRQSLAAERGGQEGPPSCSMRRKGLRPAEDWNDGILEYWNTGMVEYWVGEKQVGRRAPR